MRWKKNLALVASLEKSKYRIGDAVEGVKFWHLELDHLVLVAALL